MFMSWIKALELQVVFCMAFHGQQKIVESQSDTAAENGNQRTLEMPAAARSPKNRACAA
jgi:hypothetical protein